jgi:hypothetical protein
VAIEERISLVRRLDARFEAEHSRGEGRIRDVSHHGLFVASPLLPPDGSEIELVFETPSSRPITITGVVRWNTVPLAGRRGASGFGVQLTTFGDDFSHFVEGALSAGTPLSSPGTSA